MNLTIAVPTRDRASRLKDFVRTFMETTDNGNRPQLLIVHDSPTKEESICISRQAQSVIGANTIIIPEKSSLTELWNHCIMFTNTDWVLVCNDDAQFHGGWLEYLQQHLNTNQFDQINLLHYGGFCIHKRFILKVGWFDERFRGGGFEDIDHQLRVNESNYKDLVDRSQDFKLMSHHKFSDGTDWHGLNNDQWILQKWGRRDLWNWKIPSFRKHGEIDWHPAYTIRYEEKYNMKSELQAINSLINTGVPLHV